MWVIFKDMEQAKIKLLSQFVKKISGPGICEVKLYENDGESLVVVLIDLNFVKSTQAQPHHVAIGIRNFVKDRIKDYLGFDVEVSSMAGEDC